MKPNLTDDQKLICLDWIHCNLWVFDPGAAKDLLPSVWDALKKAGYTGSADELETPLLKVVDQIKNCRSKPKFIKGPVANDKYKDIRESFLAQGHRVGDGLQHHEPVQTQQQLDRGGDPRGIPVLFGPPPDDRALPDVDDLEEEEYEEEEYEALPDDEYHLADGTLVRNIDVQEEYAEEQNGAQDLDVGGIRTIDAPEANDPAVEHEDNEEMVAPEAEENVIEWNGRLEASVAVEDVDQIQFHGPRDQVTTPPAPNATEAAPNVVENDVQVLRKVEVIEIDQPEYINNKANGIYAAVKFEEVVTDNEDRVEELKFLALMARSRRIASREDPEVIGASIGVQVDPPEFPRTKFEAPDVVEESANIQIAQSPRSPSRHDVQEGPVIIPPIAEHRESLPPVNIGIAEEAAVGEPSDEAPLGGDQTEDMVETGRAGDSRGMTPPPDDDMVLLENPAEDDDIEILEDEEPNPVKQEPIEETVAQWHYDFVTGSVVPYFIPPLATLPEMAATYYPRPYAPFAPIPVFPQSRAQQQAQMAGFRRAQAALRLQQTLAAMNRPREGPARNHQSGNYVEPRHYAGDTMSNVDEQLEDINPRRTSPVVRAPARRGYSIGQPGGRGFGRLPETDEERGSEVMQGQQREEAQRINTAIAQRPTQQEDAPRGLEKEREETQGPQVTHGRDQSAPRKEAPPMRRAAGGMDIAEGGLETEGVAQVIHRNADEPPQVEAPPVVQAPLVTAPVTEVLTEAAPMAPALETPPRRSSFSTGNSRTKEKAPGSTMLLRSGRDLSASKPSADPIDSNRRILPYWNWKPRNSQDGPVDQGPTPISTGSGRTPVSQGQETQRKRGKTVGGVPNPKTAVAAVRRGGRSVVRTTSGATAASTASTSNKTPAPTAIRPGRAGYRDGKFVDVDRAIPALSATWRGRGRTPQAAKSTATTVKTRGRTPKATACGGERTPAKRGRTPANSAASGAPARTKATAAKPRGRTPKAAASEEEKTTKRRGKSPGGEVPRKKGRSVYPTARVPPASKKNGATPRSEATRKRSRSVAHPPSQDHSADSRELSSHFRSPVVKDILNFFASNMPEQELASVSAHVKSFLDQKNASTAAKKRRNG